eukprot:6529989-Pyramimonas_sp.AAC.1
MEARRSASAAGQQAPTALEVMLTIQGWSPAPSGLCPDCIGPSPAQAGRWRLPTPPDHRVSRWIGFVRSISHFVAPQVFAAVIRTAQ